jgi:hypothetical protein
VVVHRRVVVEPRLVGVALQRDATALVRRVSPTHRSESSIVTTSVAVRWKDAKPFVNC